MQVGVTGGIGAGKSTICKILQVLGIPVYDADSRARQLMESSSELRRQIQHAFGKESYIDGSLNRSYLAEIVFSNEDEVAKLNELVHPKVGEDYGFWADKYEDLFPYIVKEAALLIESGSYQQLDYIVVVQSPEELRIERVMSRDPHRDQDQIRAIMDKQLSDAARNAHADTVIFNDEKQSLLNQVFELHQSLIK